MFKHSLIAVLVIFSVACTPRKKRPERPTPEPAQYVVPEVQGEPERELTDYTRVALTADTSHLSPAQKRILPKLIEASRLMEEAFWVQAYGDRDALLSQIKDPKLQRFAEINFGPWDRLADNAPFIDGVGAKPVGANLYPTDLTKEELTQAAEKNPKLTSLYTMVRRNAAGDLEAIPYSKFFAEQIVPAAKLLDEAAALAEDPGFKKHLSLRAQALRTDDYFASDMAWMDMKDNAIDIVIGPIETYEDQLIGAKASFEGYVLLKDLEWSKRLQRYAALLPELQRGLPVAAKYKSETPGRDSDLNAYDVVFYAGDCNAGAKTIAINLPNDEKVQLEKGTRRLQLKNAMRAKFDAILEPISEVLMAPEQRKHITFDAFFSNTMFHEVAHGLGIKKTVTGEKTVREALGNLASALEEGKADVLGLYMIRSLFEKGELEGDGTLMDNYTTFAAGIFRSIRFGAASAHGRANLVRFNFFKERGAFRRSAEGLYSVDANKMEEAVTALSRAILQLQGNGDYDAAKAFTEKYGIMDDTLRADLDRIAEAKVPVDIVFDQGPEVLGL